MSPLFRRLEHDVHQIKFNAFVFRMSVFYRGFTAQGNLMGFQTVLLTLDFLPPNVVDPVASGFTNL